MASVNNNSNASSSQTENQNRFSILEEQEFTGNKNDEYQQMETDELERKNHSDKVNSTNNSYKEHNNTTNFKQGNSIIKDTFLCPPIFIRGLSVKDIQTNLKNLPSNIKMKFINLPGSRIKLFVNSIEFHKKIIEELRNLGVEAYSFTPKEEKKTSLLLKGIDYNFTSAEVAEALLTETRNEIEILKVYPFSTPKSKRENRPLNMFVVQIKNQTDANKIVNTKFILHQRISWDKLRKKETIRCFRCQHFGHGSEYCTSPSTCVFCGGNHDVSNCPEILNKKNNNAVVIPTCANCKQSHTASYKGCPGYINYVRKREALKQKAKEAINSRKEFISSTVGNYVRGNITFADMARSGIRNHVSNNILKDNNIPQFAKNNYSNDNSLARFMNEAKSLFNRSFPELLKEIKQFWPKYQNLNSKEEKMTAYLHFLASIVT